MPQLVDIDGKTVPVLSRKTSDLIPRHWINPKYRDMAERWQNKTVWVAMTTDHALSNAGLKYYGSTTTADGWEHLVELAELIKYLKTVTPPFKLM